MGTVQHAEGAGWGMKPLSGAGVRNRGPILAMLREAICGRRKCSRSAAAPGTGREPALECAFEPATLQGR